MKKLITRQYSSLSFRSNFGSNTIHRLIIIVMVSMLSACSSIGTNTKASLSENIHAITFSSPSAEQRVIIYNHGTVRPMHTERCYFPNNKPPRSLTSLIDHKTLVYRLCSTATELPSITSAGNQVYLRKQEINHAIDAFLARGIKPKHLFLAGHSNGGWTSLMMMRDVNKRFNGVIAYAPAFAGKRSEVKIAPWWRKLARPKQIKDMLGAARMDALVFAYEHDAYNRPQELQFLVDNYPKVNPTDANGVELISYYCGLRNSHQTFRKDCRFTYTVRKIRRFVESQIHTWKN